MTWNRISKGGRLVYMDQDYKEMQQISLYLPRPWLVEMKALVEKGEFPHRSELIRFAVKNLLMELRSIQPIQKEVF